MDVDFNTVADDFFVNLNLQTTLALPDGRETVLQFCEAVQKQFPSMTCLFQRDSGEFVLESDREAGTYQWMELQSHRLSAGHFNPPEVGEAFGLHRWLLDRSVYFLGVGGLDVECLDVMLGFNLDYVGNRDGIVAEALIGNSPLVALVGEGLGKCVEFEPGIVFALDSDCYLQARLSLETRCSSYQIRTGNFADEPISVYFTVRHYPTPGKMTQLTSTFDELCEICLDVAGRIIIPQIVSPIAAAIATG